MLPALPIISQLLYIADEEILCDACWALARLTSIPENIQHAINYGILRRVSELLGHTSLYIVIPAVRIIGNIAQGDDCQVQNLINVGVLRTLEPLLQSPKKRIRLDALYALSGITAGPHEHTQILIDLNIFPRIVHLLSTSELQTRKEALWVLANAVTQATSPQIQYIVSQGIFSPLTELLTKIEDVELILLVLHALEAILAAGEKGKTETDSLNLYAVVLEEAGCLDKLEMYVIISLPCLAFCCSVVKALS